MKILLINPLVREWAKPNVFPAGLGYIAAVLLRAGHEVEVLDINALRISRDEVQRRLAAASYDVAGIGGIVTVYRYVKWLVAVLQQNHPERPVIIGGSVGSSIPEVMLRNNPVAAVCLGEGELTVVELVRALGNGGSLAEVPGIAYRAADGTIQTTPPRPVIADLDTVPFPAWGLFPMEIYLKNPVGAPNRNKWQDGAAGAGQPLSINLTGTRGCPYKCIYCYHDFMGAGYRVRSPHNIVAEMATLYDRYGVTYFHITDDEFVVKRDFIYAFCRQVAELSQRLGVRLTWGCAGRVNLMDEELIVTMRDAGCVLIGYGIESGSQRMLDFIRKDVTVDQARRAIRLTQQHLGWADASFMIGYPGETQETIRETVDFCKDLGLEPEVIFFMTPYPGTELYAMARAQGRIADEEAYLLDLGEQGEKIRVNFTDFSDAELYAIQKQLVQELNAWNKSRHPEAG